MQSDSSEVERRVRRYWYNDGLGELIAGGGLILLGIYFALQEFLGSDSLLSTVLQASFLLLFVGGAFLSQRLVHLLKARLTYPRTGYVEYRANQHTTWMGLWAAGLGFIMAALMVGLVHLFPSFDSLVAFTALIGGLLFVVLALKSAGITRFYLLGVVTLVLGVVLSISGLPRGYGLGAFYAAVGACLLVSGGWTLRRYLQRNPGVMED